MTTLIENRAEAKERWTAALRSGDYVQGQNHLRQTRADGTIVHCCLGVECDVLYPGHWNDEQRISLLQFREPGRIYVARGDQPPRGVPLVHPTPLGFFRITGELDDDTGFLADVAERAEIEAYTTGSWPHLAVLNDEWGFTFAQIADVIDAIEDPDQPFAWCEPHEIEYQHRIEYQPEDDDD